ncbi:MAG: TetR/AcrR family transcriptional regulator [Archangium sp.]
MTRRAARPPRERIIDSALALFGAHGVEATSVQAVAEHAGMSKQALLHHFPSKELLRQGVYERLSVLLREALPAAATELVSRSHDRYRALLEVALAGFEANPELSRFLVFELLSRPDEVVAWLRSEGAPWLGLVRGVVKQQSESTGDTEAHVAVLGVMMLMHSALVPRGDKRWRARMAKATLKVMQLGSNLK